MRMGLGSEPPNQSVFMGEHLRHNKRDTALGPEQKHHSQIVNLKGDCRG